MEFKGLNISENKNEYVTPIDVSENKAGRFLSLSVFLHAVLVACVTVMSIPPVELSQKEVVEFEVDSDVTAVKTQGPPPAVVVDAAVPVKMAPAKAVATVADTLDDIETPDLETSEFGEVAVAQMDEKDLQEDFDQIDNDQNKALAAVKQSLDEEVDQVSSEGDSAFAEVENENKAQAQAAAEALAERQQEYAAAIASAKAAEKATAERAAQLAAQEKTRGQGAGGKGQGSGNSGSPEPTKQVAGIPGGVRSLEQLRQIPGNKFPQYSSEERLARQEGKAMFYAYVNKDGNLSQFKLGQSTGYRNLDVKTLAALKKWKFYPGQEGWVEMPFKWALKGEALEAGGRLR